MSHPELFCSVEQGKLRGQYEKDMDGKPFISFWGIPYAKPPLGKLRFKPPQPPEKWKGIRGATKEGNPCCSIHFNVEKNKIALDIVGSEDCLVLNVFTHQVLADEMDDLKPVMVFVHGGAFVTGSSRRASCGPEFFMTEDIVLVTLNYRLGVLGFLVVDDPELNVNGNAGLKDQVEALKWVQRNISQFSGDPNNVTLFGQSAGAASVHCLLLSPTAEGLFHKAILQSGTALCPWSRGINDGQDLMQILRFTDSNPKKILEFLQRPSAEELVQAEQKLPQYGLSPAHKRQFGLAIEPRSEQSILHDEPINIINSGSYNHVPMILGYASLEGILEAHADEHGLAEDFENLVPYYFAYPKESEEFKKINEKLSQFYFGKAKPDKEDKKSFTDFFTDAIFLRGIYLAMQLHVKTSQKPVYYYRMSLETDLNSYKKMIRTKLKGSCHGECTRYIFKKEGIVVKQGGIEEKSVRRIVRMWCNFARCGNPIPEKDLLLNCEWLPVEKNKINFLEIDQELKPGVDTDMSRMQFWEEITNNITMRY